jgi:hypothetical protein
MNDPMTGERIQFLKSRALFLLLAWFLLAAAVMTACAPELGQIYRHAEQGFAFSTIPGYSTGPYLGVVAMTPEVEPEDVDVFFLLGVEESSMDTNPRGVFDNLVGEEGGEGYDIDPIKETTLQGQPALLSGWQVQGREEAVRLAIVQLGPRRHFYMVATSYSAAGRRQVERYFTSVLESVTFFPPGS